MTTPLRRIPRTGSATSLTTRELIALLAEQQPGDVLTYTAILSHVGIDVQIRRDLLQTARRVVRRLYQREFDVLVNVGLQCLAEPEKIGVATKRRFAAHRHAERTIEVLQNIDLGALSPLEMHKYLGEASIAAMVSLATEETTVRQIEQQAGPQPLMLDPRVHAGLFRGL